MTAKPASPAAAPSLRHLYGASAGVRADPKIVDRPPHRRRGPRTPRRTPTGSVATRQVSVSRNLLGRLVLLSSFSSSVGGGRGEPVTGYGAHRHPAAAHRPGRGAVLVLVVRALGGRAGGLAGVGDLAVPGGGCLRVLLAHGREHATRTCRLRDTTAPTRLHRIHAHSRVPRRTRLSNRCSDASVCPFRPVIPAPGPDRVP